MRGAAVWVAAGTALFILLILLVVRPVLRRFIDRWEEKPLSRPAQAFLYVLLLLAAGAAAALFGPRHGGANEAVVKMLNEIADVKNVPAYIERVKRGEFRLMGFGHRVYKNYDPRAKIIKKIAYDVFGVTGSNPLIDVAVAMEEVALNDEYFVARKLYPNVDFYLSLIHI